VELRLDNYILKAFLASGLMSLVMMILALGLIQLFRYGPSLPLSIILTLAAIAFVLSASFFERYEVGSILWSMLVSLIATLILTLLSGGVIYGITMHTQSWEQLLSGLAICMIIATTLLNYLKRSLGEIEY
jgi:dolichyl-phosphate-mannose--protein O-mannosyl transferase